MSDIPLSRAMLDLTIKDLARALHRAKVARSNLDRRKGRYRAFGTRAKMTPALKAKIIACAAAHPRWDNQRIAEKFNVGNGRVSVALNGYNK